MHPKALLAAAASLIERLLAFEQPADRVVADFMRANRAIGSRERPLVAETAYAVVRRLPLYRHMAESAAADPSPLPRRLAILAWPGAAAALDAALSADESGVWGAARSRLQALDPQMLPDALRHGLPAWLAERLRAQLGEDEFWRFVDATMRPAPLDLRVNLMRTSRGDAIASLAEAAIAAAPTAHSPIGLRVDGKPALQGLPVYDSGSVEVQDEGSQLLSLVLGARRGETVVDYCAGAGGKTLAIGAQMRGSGRLYAFDTSAHRLEAMRPRLDRSGLGHVVAMQLQGDRDERLARLHGKCDRVLVDAPCTGLGTLRRNPDLKWRHGEASLAGFAATQLAILGAAARLVRPNGRLVYATCSPLREEDEAVAAAFDAGPGAAWQRLAMRDLLAQARIVDADALVLGDDLRLWTQRHGTDCFYAVAWQR